MAERLIPSTNFLVRRAIRITASEEIKLLLWLDGAEFDIFCIFRSDLTIPSEVMHQINAGTLLLPAIYRGTNTRGEHVFDIINTFASTPIRVFMVALN
jgi:hypothetical protein